MTKVGRLPTGRCAKVPNVREGIKSIRLIHAKRLVRPHFSTILGHMNKPMTLNVRIGGALSDFVATNVGDQGAYENVSEYVRDLIRRDKERTEAEQFDRLKAELTRAFAAPQSSYAPLDANAVIARNRRA